MEIFSKANFTHAHLDWKRAETFKKLTMEFEYGTGEFLDEFLEFFSVCVLGSISIPF